MPSEKIRIDCLYSFTPVPFVEESIVQFEEHESKSWFRIAIKTVLAIGCLIMVYNLFTPSTAINSDPYAKEAQGYYK